MKESRMWKLGLAVVFSLTLAMVGCGGGGGGGDVAAVNPDTDGDGVPNSVDAFPNDPARFVSNVTVLLTGLAGQAGFSAATGVNNTGAVVGFSEATAAPAGVKAVRWTVNPVDGSASGPATLSPISAAGAYSAAYGVNGAGTIVGDSESAAGGNFVAASWAPNAASGTAATALPSSATFPSTGRSAAYAINNNAAPIIVGEATTAAGALHAVAWNGTTGAPVDLGIFPNGTFSAAYGVSDNGLVVGEADTAPGVTHACAWIVNATGKAAGPVDLGIVTVGDVRSIAFGVDATGQVVGESENQAGEVHAALWKMDPGTLQAPQATKKDLGANGTAYAINDVSRIVGNLGTTDLGTVWDTRNLALPDTAAAPGTTFSQALGLNSTNVVVGMSGTATGARAFVAFPK